VVAVSNGTLLQSECLTSGGTQDVSLRLAGALATGVFEFASRVSDVRLDPDDWVLWRLVLEGGICEGLRAVYPNPSNGDPVVLRYWLDAAASGRLSVYDARGLLVASRGVPDGLAGLNELEWRAQAGNGSRVPSGVYLAVPFPAGARLPIASGTR
jgi:hypothetical protein